MYKESKVYCGIRILLPQIFHRNICGGTIALCIKLKGNFFREKVSLIPFKNRFVKSVPLSADSGLRLCLKNLPPFEKGGRKLLVSHSKHFRLTPPHPISPNILKGHDNRKKLVATAQRRERIYKRTAEPSVTFCGEEEQRNGRLIFCVAK